MKETGYSDLFRKLLRSRRAHIAKKPTICIMGKLAWKREGS